MACTQSILPEYFPVTCHTVHVGPGSTFVAIKGSKEDGRQYIPEALAKGARLIVVQEDAGIGQEMRSLVIKHGGEILVVPDARRALAELSAQANGFPATKMKIIGVTGTKGKTTSSFLLEHMFKSAGYKTALITTVRNRILDHDWKVSMTTPQPDYVHTFLRVAFDRGVEIVIIETSAQALSLHRLHGIRFDGILFTNFEQEHLEFYPNLQAYFDAKKQIFGYRHIDGPAVINGDDARVGALQALYENVYTFGFKQEHDFQGTLIGDQSERVAFKISHNSTEHLVECPALVGRFNAYNCLGALMLSAQLGVDMGHAVRALTSFHKVPGRLERYVLPNGSLCFIDHAHTPSSFEAVLSLLRPQTKQLIVVFGAGGDRDRTKRPIMGDLVSRYADVVFVTSDNPRTEDLNAINAEILNGIAAENIHKVVVELDREKAIRNAYAQSKPGSIIVLLGKGADEYQIVGATVTRFSEAEIIKSFV